MSSLSLSLTKQKGEDANFSLSWGQGTFYPVL